MLFIIRGVFFFEEMIPAKAQMPNLFSHDGSVVLDRGDAAGKEAETKQTGGAEMGAGKDRAGGKLPTGG